MCGEKPDDGTAQLYFLGSPPRVRGEVRHGLEVGQNVGITPACAGRSSRRMTSSAAGLDHPRVCGEKHYTRIEGINIIGSPPRVRGEAQYVVQWSSPSGITPACAGRSRGTYPLSCAVLDHPRVCGEKSPSPCILGIDVGSPPRVRGEEGIGYACQAFVRITPACAGRSILYKIKNPCWWDHPRVCGEKCSLIWSICVCMGSPPRVRGEAGYSRPA